MRSCRAHSAILRRLPVALAALWLLFQCLPAAAAGATSSGRDFWVGFTPTGAQVTPLLFISGSTATNGTVSVPGLDFSTSFSITPGTATTVSLPASATVTSNETVESLGVHVTAGADVSVYGLDYTAAATDGFLGLPVAADGTDYIVLGYNSFPAGLEGTYRSQYLIVATQNGTTVQVTPSSLDPDCAPITLTLDAGQTWRHRACDAFDEDVTGTHISASAPIAVFGGHECTNIPDAGFVYCNQIVEQMTPTSAWGKRFLTEPFAQRAGGDVFRVLASADGTQVSVNGAAAATLAAGTYYQISLAAGSLIETSQPALVAQYSNSSSFDNNANNADSSEMLVPPLEQYLAVYTVSTPDNTTTDITTNFINVIAPDSVVGTTLLDGSPILPESFSAIGGSGFSGAQIAVGVGSHTLSGPLPFGIFVYGYGSFDNYSYTGGFSVSPVALVSTVVLGPKTNTVTIGGQACLALTVADQNDQPLAGIRADFSVGGANPGSGFAVTDTAGNAQFCYTGQNVGQDTVTGSVGGKSDSAVVTWKNKASVTLSLAPGPGGGGTNPPGTIFLGDNAMLTWQSEGVTSCTASGAWSGTRGPSGSFTVHPNAAGIYTYTLDCTGANGDASGSATLTVALPPPPELELSLSSATIAEGESALLSWSSRYASSCTAAGGDSRGSGTSGSLLLQARAAGTTTYSLDCTGRGGASHKSVTLTVTRASTGGSDGSSGGSGGGGGSFSPASLLLLLAARQLRRRAVRH